MHALETLPFNAFPLVMSILVALGGLFLGWWVYGRDPLEAEERDPGNGFGLESAVADTRLDGFDLVRLKADLGMQI